MCLLMALSVSGEMYSDHQVAPASASEEMYARSSLLVQGVLDCRFSMNPCRIK